jgi:hypothetical protein
MIADKGTKEIGFFDPFQPNTYIGAYLINRLHPELEVHVAYDGDNYIKNVTDSLIVRKQILFHMKTIGKRSNSYNDSYYFLFK